MKTQVVVRETGPANRSLGRRGLRAQLEARQKVRPSGSYCFLTEKGPAVVRLTPKGVVLARPSRRAIERGRRKPTAAERAVLAMFARRG